MKQKRGSGWLALSLVVIGIVLLWRFPRWTVDDAFISARYASNLLHHRALVWNVGEVAVDGYTGFAWPLTMAAGMAVGGMPEGIGQLLGALSFIGMLWLLWRLAQQLRLPSLPSLLLLALFIGRSGSYVHAFSGLETLAFCSAIMASLLAFARLHGGAASPRSPVLWGVLLLTSLLRPEGVVLAGAIFLMLVVQRHRHDEKQREWLRTALICYVAPALLYYVWRTLYYGDWLPNTFYVKSFAGAINPASLRSLLVICRNEWLIPTILILTLLAISGEAERQRLTMLWRRSWPLWVSIALFTAAVIVSNLRSMLWMNYADRLWFPLFAPSWLAMLAFASALWPHHLSATPKRRLALLIVVIGIVGQGALMARAWPTDRRYVQRYHAAIESAARPAGMQIAELLPANERLAVVDAGIIPYLAQRPTLDLGGLNDRELGHNFSIDGAVERFFAVQPGAFVIVVPPRQLADSPSIAGRIVRDPRFANYQLVKRIPATGAASGNEAMIYLRTDLLARATTFPAIN